MPNIVGAEVDWMESWANWPQLKVTIDSPWQPTNTTFRYKKYPPDQDKQVMLIARLEPWVRFVYVDDPSYDAIRGGALGGNYMLEDGSTFKSRSGWSSREGVINKYRGDKWDLPEEIVEVTSKMPGEYGGYVSFIDVSKALDVVKEFLPDIHLIRVLRFDDEPYWVPSMETGRVVKPSGKVCNA